MSHLPAFSIVICTNSRSQSLAKTLDSLCWLDYPHFEVCVVSGPSNDGSAEVLERWRGRIKIAHCPQLDLTKARNIGIAMSAGDIIAMLDDDAIPEPEWITELAAAYESPEVAGAGGFVHDWDGIDFQQRYATFDRLGWERRDWSRPVPEFNFPLSASFPHLIGTNCSFRNEALLSIGGFDERYGRFYEDVDVCCRLLDHGYRLVQVAGAYVHHKRLPDWMRNEHRAFQHWYLIIRNKIVFSLANGRGHHGLAEALEDADRYIETYRTQVQHDISEGRLPRNASERFEMEAKDALRDGLRDGLEGTRQLITNDTREQFAQPFLPFITSSPRGGRRTICVFSQSYPPGPMAGIARYMHQLARGLAALGHQVHVLTRAENAESVDFEDGVWVHRVAVGYAPPPSVTGEPPVPQVIWNHAATMFREVVKIADRKRVDCIYAPLWDCEGIAALFDGRFPLIVGLQTPMRVALATHERLRSNRRFMAELGTPIMTLEKRLLEGADSVHASSHAIMREIEDTYGVRLRSRRVAVIPLGLDDWSSLPSIAPPSLQAGRLRLLFVGRLEPRKGIGVLIDVAKRLLDRYPQLHLDIVGDDTIHGPGGGSYRESFAADPEADGIRDRVIFHGAVSDEALRGFYRACDIFVAPSLFESFGLILLEAMMFAKPLVACRSGGMVEIVEDCITGLLAEPGDVDSLESCLARLVDDASLRHRLGRAARRRYEEQFTPEYMARGIAELLAAVVDGRTVKPRREARPALAVEP